MLPVTLIAAACMAVPATLHGPSRDRRLLSSDRHRADADMCLLPDGSAMVASQWLLAANVRRVSLYHCRPVRHRWACRRIRDLVVPHEDWSMDHPTLICPTTAPSSRAPTTAPSSRTPTSARRPPRRTSRNWTIRLWTRQRSPDKQRSEVLSFQIDVPISKRHGSIVIVRPASIAVRALGALAIAGLPQALKTRIPSPPQPTQDEAGSDAGATARTTPTIRVPSLTPFARLDHDGHVILSLSSQQDGCFIASCQTNGTCRFLAKGPRTARRCGVLTMGRHTWLALYHQKGTAPNACRMAWSNGAPHWTWSIFPSRLYGCDPRPFLIASHQAAVALIWAPGSRLTVAILSVQRTGANTRVWRLVRHRTGLPRSQLRRLHPFLAGSGTRLFVSYVQERPRLLFEQRMASWITLTILRHKHARHRRSGRQRSRAERSSERTRSEK